ncbi:hypothetical protein ACFWYW_59065 [Nonomuraea sp. NPDC059023]|uniref:beta barrel domain-containing protein n=1 Tax=unclassified Nonomuraea TaxID=2593643 RepID=UPI0036BF6CEE
MLNVRVGDEVIVCEPNGRNSRHCVATVTAVRRKLFTVQADISWLSGDYRLDTGRQNGGSTVGYGPPFVKTMAQHQLDRRMSDALAVLSAHRVTLDRGHKLTLEQVEAIAELVRPADSPEEG